jgi:tetratricopeptide (TPR) repeat protein
MVRDEEYYLRQTLQHVPRSSAAWKNLVIFYKDRKRWDDAVKMLYGYLDVYPYAYQFASIIAGQMVNAGRLEHAIPFLEYAVAMGKHYDDYQLLGVALQWKGDKQRAAKIFEESIPLAPDDWEVYFHLAETYAQMGRRDEAIAMYRRVLERRANSPRLKDCSKQLWLLLIHPHQNSRTLITQSYRSFTPIVPAIRE